MFEFILILTNTGDPLQ